MTTKTYKLDSEKMIELERLHYESESYSSIIAFMLNQKDFDIESESFTNYNKKFLETSMKYSKIKEEITIKYVKKEFPNAISWAADFNEGHLTVMIED